MDKGLVSWSSCFPIKYILCRAVTFVKKAKIAIA